MAGANSSQVDNLTDGSKTIYITYNNYTKKTDWIKTAIFILMPNYKSFKEKIIKKAMLNFAGRVQSRVWRVQRFVLHP